MFWENLKMNFFLLKSTELIKIENNLNPIIHKINNSRNEKQPIDNKTRTKSQNKVIVKLDTSQRSMNKLMAKASDLRKSFDNLSKILTFERSSCNVMDNKVGQNSKKLNKEQEIGVIIKKEINKSRSKREDVNQKAYNLGEYCNKLQIKWNDFASTINHYESIIGENKEKTSLK